MDLLRFVPIIAAVACPLGMGLMMWLMHRQMGGSGSRPAAGPPSAHPVVHLDALRQQRAALDIEIAEVTELVDLRQQRAALDVKREALASLSVPSGRQG